MPATLDRFYRHFCKYGPFVLIVETNWWILKVKHLPWCIFLQNIITGEYKTHNPSRLESYFTDLSSCGDKILKIVSLLG